MSDLDVRERTKALLSKPSYRTKLLVFVLIAAITAILAARATDVFVQEILSNFFVTFLAVALIQFLWDFLGGDPIDSRLTELNTQTEKRLSGVEEQIRSLDKQIENRFLEARTEMRSLEDSMIVMGDLLDGNLGIERIWADRRTWQVDPKCGLRVWKETVCQAKTVKIASNTLWNNWFNDGAFVDRFFAHLHHGATAQIIIYDPESSALQMRAIDEEDVDLGLGMRTEIRSTLDRIARSELAESLMVQQSTSQSPALEIRLSQDYLLLSQIVQADNQMLVAVYLSGQTGGPSPTLQLRGQECAYYRTFARQFDVAWKRARPISLPELQAFSGSRGPAPLETNP